MALVVSNKSKSHSYNHNKNRHLYDHNKNAKCRYCGKKEYYKKEYWIKEKDKKSRKLKKTLQKQKANTIDKKDFSTNGEFMFVAILYITMNHKE